MYSELPGCLERVTQTQLQSAIRLIRILVGNLPERLAVRVGIGTIPIQMVQEVERFGAERQILVFRCVEVLEQPGVPVLETGIVEHVAAELRGEGASRGLRDVRRCT